MQFHEKKKMIYLISRVFFANTQNRPGFGVPRSATNLKEIALPKKQNSTIEGDTRYFPSVMKAADVEKDLSKY